MGSPSEDGAQKFAQAPRLGGKLKGFRDSHRILQGHLSLPLLTLPLLHTDLQILIQDKISFKTCHQTLYVRSHALIIRSSGLYQITPSLTTASSPLSHYIKNYPTPFSSIQLLLARSSVVSKHLPGEECFYN